MSFMTDTQITVRGDIEERAIELLIQT